MNTLIGFLLAGALLTTLGVLFAGLVTMARGGEANRKHGNRLMRWRVIAQGTAIAIFAVAMLLSASD